MTTPTDQPQRFDSGVINSSEEPPTQQEQPQQSQSQNVQTKLLQHFQTNRIDSALWALRLLVIFFTVSYVLPIFK